MANTRTYSIVINGVEQSVKAVDSLLTKLDALDQRIQKLQKLNLDLAQNQGGTSGSNDSASKSKYDAAKSEAAAQKEVADAIALQNSENQKALQLLVKKKQETKEQVNIQKQIAQGIRDESGAYANTLQGQRQMLADMKKELANTDLNSDDWVTLRDRVAEVNEKVKEMEESFGVFQRNVGNYKSAAEGFQGFSVAVGDTTRNFGSLREAAKTLKNEMMGIDTTTAEGRAQFDAYEQALHDVSIAQDQMADAADRAASSSKGLHDTLEMMEGLTAVAGVGQGISSLFGLDDSGLGEQITKLQSLMTIMQSIKTLQDQMERGVGGGGWIMKLWKGLDHPIASLKKLSAGLKTTKTDITAVGAAGNAGAAGMTAFSTATNAATVAVKAFAKATIILAVLQALVWVVDKLIDGFTALAKLMSNPAYESQERAMNNIEIATEAATDALSAYNDELERQVTAGIISPIEASAKAIDNFEKKLDENVAKLHAWALNLEDEDMRTDLSTLFSKKSADEAIANLQAVENQLKNMDPATEEFDNECQTLALNVVRSMQEVSLSGEEELAKFINALNASEFGQTAMQKFIDNLPDEARDTFQSVLDSFYSMADQMANRAAQLHNDMMSLFKSIEDEYNNTFDTEEERITRKHNERLKKLDEARAGIRNGDDARAWEEARAREDANYEEQLRKSREHENKKTASVKSGGRARVAATKSAGRARVSAAKDIASQLEAIEKRIQNDKIQTMRDGLAKTLAQLDLERRNRIEQAEKARKELGEKGEETYQRELLSIQELYAKKEFDIKKEWLDKWTDYQEQVQLQLEQRTRAFTQLELDYKGNQNQNWLDKETMDAEVNAVQRLVQRVKVADDEMKRILKETGVKDLLEKYIKNPTDETLQEVARILDEYEISLRETFDSKGKPQYSFYYTDDEEYYRTLTRLHEIGKEMKKLYEQMDELSGKTDEESLLKGDELWQQVVKLKNEYDELYNSFDKSSMALSNPEFRFHDWQAYYARLYDIQKEYAEKSKDLRLEEIDEEERTSLYDEWQEYSKIRKDIEEKYKQHYQDIEDDYSRHQKEIEEECDRHLAEMQKKDTKQIKNASKKVDEMEKLYGKDSEQYANALAEYQALIPDQIALIVEKNDKIEQLEDEKNKKLVELDEWRNTQIGWFAEKYNEANSLIQRNFNEKRLKAENDFIRESQTAMANYYSGLLNEFQMFQNRFVQKANNLQEKSKNAWGILDLSKYSKGINDLKATFKNLLKSIDDEQNELIRKLGANEISLGDFNSAYNELEDLKEEANETIETLTKMGKNKIGEFIESINQYIQAVGQGAQELLSTVWDAQSAALDAQQEALEKANQELDKQLQKQEDITRKHADKINAIEDELSTARGDRRQHLIDALSAQISAQRASLAAEQRIQKQKEANEKKMEALEKKRKEAQRKQDIISATISAALATVNGLATQPFVPTGIAMGALAAALGAAQVAIIASKHYAKGGRLDGGVADGPRHSQGGIKVLGGRAEIEGGEFITNRRTTKQNVGVLDFINSKKRKLNLGDFVEYYSTVGRKSVTGVRSRFADGGTLPDLNTDTDWGGLIQTVVVDRDDRPIWVSVKEISDVQSDVKRVQAMAGMGR
jgi:hypothetical protein